MTKHRIRCPALFTNNCELRKFKIMEEERVCVTGATGHLGLSVVEELRARDVPVVAVARNSTEPNVSRLRELGAVVVFVDASKKEESYADALVSVKTAISCMASIPDFLAIDRDANIRFGRQALQAGVRHLLLVATFEGRASMHMSAFTAAKEEAVDTLQRECEHYGATFTVLRPNAYFKDLTDQAFESVLTHGRHTVLGDGFHRINPIAREDVASFVADCVQETRGGEYLLGGPDIFTFREIGILAAQVIGNEQILKIRVIPLWLLRLVAFILSVLGHVSGAARHYEAITNWMLYVSTHDAVAPSSGKRHLLDEYKRKFENVGKEKLQ